MKIKLFLFAAFAAVATLAGCSDSKGGGDEPPPPPPQEEEFAVVVTPKEYEASVRITPKSDNAKKASYMAMAIAEDIYEGCEGDAASCVQTVMDILMTQNPGITIEDVVDYVTAEGRNQGTRTIQLIALAPGTQSYMVVCGLAEDGEFTTAAQLTPFETKELPELVPATCTFNMTIPTENITAGSVTVQVAPSASTTPWTVQVLTKVDYETYFGGSPDVIEETLNTGFMMAISGNMGISMEDLLKQVTLTGSKEVTMELDPETEYLVFVCGVDAYGRATTDVVVENFKTLAFKPSDAKITSSILKLYDGTEAVKQYPEGFEDVYNGSYFTRLAAEFSETAAQWVVLGTPDNLTSYTDIQIIQIMKGMIAQKQLSVMDLEGSKSSFTDVYGVPYEGKETMTVYLYAYAMNAAGEPGDVDKKNIVANKANLSDVSELAPAPEATKAAARFSKVNMENVEMQRVDFTGFSFKAMPADTKVFFGL